MRAKNTINLAMFIVAAIILVPIMITSVVAAILSIINQRFAEYFGEPGGFVESLFGGRGAPQGSFIRYAVFMIGILIAWGCWFCLSVLWNRYKSSENE